MKKKLKRVYFMTGHISYKLIFIFALGAVVVFSNRYAILILQLAKSLNGFYQ